MEHTHLDELIPEHVTLTDKQRTAIVQKAKNGDLPKQMRTAKMTPIFISAAVISILCFFIFTFLGEIERKETLSDLIEAGIIREIKAEEIPYESKIPSTYITETDELIYVSGSSVFSYEVENKVQRALTDDSTGATSYNIKANENWLVWCNFDNQSLHIMNRQTMAQQVISNFSSVTVILNDDLSSFYNFDDQTFTIMDLETLQMNPVHTVDEMTSTQHFSQDGQLVTMIESYTNDEKSLEFYTHDIQTGTVKSVATIPFMEAGMWTYENGFIYAEYQAKDGPWKLLRVDLATNEWTILDVPEYSGYAVHGHFLALSGLEDEQSEMALFRMEGDELVKLTTFDAFTDRLVRPRFNEEGMLLVNSEDEAYTMYIVDVNKIDE